MDFNDSHHLVRQIIHLLLGFIIIVQYNESLGEYAFRDPQPQNVKIIGHLDKYPTFYI